MHFTPDDSSGFTRFQKVNKVSFKQLLFTSISTRTFLRPDVLAHLNILFDVQNRNNFLNVFFFKG